jgi:RHS repeat-associated protein
LNRLVKTTAPDGKIAVIVWNVSGAKQSETDMAGVLTEYGYDAIGHLNQVKQTNGVTAQVTTYGFDELGNKISQTDAEGRVTKWEYDVSNQVVSRALPDGEKETFSYDASGNLISYTDFSGQITNYGYNNLDQQNQIIRPDKISIVNTYTASGQIASITVTANANSGLQAGTTTYAYDAQDRIIKQINPDGSFLAYAYDNAGNITQRSTAAGTVNYAYDANQHLTSVTDNSGKVTSYTYDATGQLATVATPNGVTSRYTYDVNGRLLQLLHQKTDGTVVTGVRYTLATNGQRIKTEEFDNLSTVTANVPVNPARTYAYQYDGVGRLTQDKLADRTGVTMRKTDYTYDKVGNRLQKSETTSSGTDITSYTYDSNDRLIQEIKNLVAGGQVQSSYTWGKNGNLASKMVGNIVTLYGWDAQDHLIEIKQGTSAAMASTIARYTYDAAGNRVQKIEPGQNGKADKITNFLIDSTFLYAQTVQENIVQENAIQLNQYIFGNGLLQKIQNLQKSFYHADGLGNFKVLTDSSGNLTDDYTYDAFGNVVKHIGSTSNPYRYSGEFFDDVIGLQYNRARWYDASIGRFISQDKYAGTSSLPITLNKYAYANDDSVNKTDPSGQTSLGETNATANIAITVSNLESTFAVDFAEAALNPSGFGATTVGYGILACLIPSSAKILLRGVKELKLVKGFVRFYGKYPPSAKEGAAALFYAERTGAKIWLRGENMKGPDAIIDGILYDIYTPKSSSYGTVAKGIREKTKPKKSGYIQTQRILIDGRLAGLSEAEIYKSIQHAVSTGQPPANLTEAIAITKSGKIIYWQP